MPTAIIIGGGLTGLTAANQLQKNKIDFLLLERSDRVGGRVKTDVIDGHRDPLHLAHSCYIQMGKKIELVIHFEIFLVYYLPFFLGLEV